MRQPAAVRQLSLAASLLTLVLVSAPAWAQTAPRPRPATSRWCRCHAQLVEQKDKSRTVSMPAKGLFKGDQLTDSAKAQLTDLIINAIGLQVEVALLIPVGPWNIDGTGQRR